MFFLLFILSKEELERERERKERYEPTADDGLSKKLGCV